MDASVGSKTKKKRHPREARFDTLLKELKRQQRALDKLSRELDAICDEVERYERHCGEKFLQPRASFAERLVDFARRKSLSNWHRNELRLSLYELLSDIEEVDPQRAYQLSDGYQRSIIELSGLTETEYRQQFLGTAIRRVRLGRRFG